MAVPRSSAGLGPWASGQPVLRMGACCPCNQTCVSWSALECEAREYHVPDPRNGLWNPAVVPVIPSALQCSQPYRELGQPKKLILHGTTLVHSCYVYNGEYNTQKVNHLRGRQNAFVIIDNKKFLLFLRTLRVCWTPNKHSSDDSYTMGFAVLTAIPWAPQCSQPYHGLCSAHSHTMGFAVLTAIPWALQ